MTLGSRRTSPSSPVRGRLRGSTRQSPTENAPAMATMRGGADPITALAPQAFSLLQLRLLERLDRRAVLILRPTRLEG
jgi:hypothetical protein